MGKSEFARQIVKSLNEKGVLVEKKLPLDTLRNIYGEKISSLTIEELKYLLTKEDLLQLFTHRRLKENVLISNLRRAIDRVYPAYLFEEYILPELDTEDQDILKGYYHETTRPEKSDGGGMERVYVLRTVPYQLTESELEILRTDLGTSASDDNIINKYYYPIKNEDRTKIYKLRDEIDEREEIELLRVMKKKEDHISDAIKAEISDILDKIEVLPGKKPRDLYFSNLYVDINHYYFFEHPNEHVPGMMLVEAARQFMTACHHKYGGIPVEGFNFILGSLDVKFSDYVELNMPVKFEAHINELYSDENGKWQDVDSTVFILQDNAEKGRIQITSSVVTDKVFKRIRKDNTRFQKRFKPRPGFLYHMNITDSHGKPHKASIEDLSLHGFSLKVSEPLINHSHVYVSSESDDEPIFQYHLELDDYMVRGKCRLRRHHEESDGLFHAAFEIFEFDKRNLENMHEVLKRFCFVIEDREII